MTTPTPARRFTGLRKVLTELCERLTAAGGGIYRVSTFIRTLHPSIMGRRYTWTDGEGVDMFEAPYAILDSDLFRLSPVGNVYETSEPVRMHLCAPGFESQYNNVAELRQEGASDYVIQPLFSPMARFMPSAGRHGGRVASMMVSWPPLMPLPRLLPGRRRFTVCAVPP